MCDIHYVYGDGACKCGMPDLSPMSHLTQNKDSRQDSRQGRWAKNTSYSKSTAGSQRTPNQIPSKSYTGTQNRNLAVSSASANTVRIDRVSPSLLNSGTELRHQMRNQIVSDTNVPRLESVNATTSRDVITEHR